MMQGGANARLQQPQGLQISGIQQRPLPFGNIPKGIANPQVANTPTNYPTNLTPTPTGRVDSKMDSKGGDNKHGIQDHYDKASSVCGTYLFLV